jgi:hypothetical protein
VQVAALRQQGDDDDDDDDDDVDLLKSVAWV